MNFEHARISSVNYSHIPSWTASGFFHGFAGRDFDVQQGSQAFKNVLGDSRSLLMLRQVHGCEVVEVGAGRLPKQSDKAPAADAWILAGNDTRGSSAERPVFGIATADCAPVLCVCRRSRLCAALHCGWRGTAAGLLPQVLNRLTELGARQIEIALGPAAESCCYQVGAEVAAICQEAAPDPEPPGANHYPRVIEQRDGSLYCSIRGLLLRQALAAGVAAEAMISHPSCTMCDEGFFSYRREKGLAGRQLTFIGR